MIRSLYLFLSTTLALLATAPDAWSEPTPPARQTPLPATMPVDTAAFLMALRQDTQTLARLSPRSDPAFDFVPAGREGERAGDGYNHVGDIHLRLRVGGGAWQDYASARHRQAIIPLPTRAGEVAAADISASLGAGLPIRVERHWAMVDGAPALRFVLVNTGTLPVEIGALGLPMVFDNIIADRDLQQAHAQASFADPYIGRDAGYVQVTRLNGAGPALLVVPERGTPLEAYVPLAEAAKAPAGTAFTEKSRRSQVSEGFYDWTIASKALAEREWAGAGTPWNAPTSFTLAPGARRQVGLRFALSPSIRAIEDTLVQQGRPVAVGIPGYVVPTDQVATLFLNSHSAVASITASPKGALVARRDGSGPGKQGKPWARYRVTAHGWGQARLTIAYVDGQKQTVSYFITKPLPQVMADLGHFSTTAQWFEPASDPFHRNPAILTYDREANHVVTQDARVWIAGMSDEGGAGSWVAAIAKQLDNPNRVEVAKLERLVDETVLGHLQVDSGPQAGGVRKSLFYYDPAALPEAYDPKIDWHTWASWSKAQAQDLGRSYNYPHVAIGHWVLYRLARNQAGLVTRHDWRFYLDWAWRTSMAMVREAPEYAQFGQMEGDVFLDILADLRHEGMTDKADAMEAAMRARADHWKSLAYPFGSEMAWDSTGQAEVYAWMRHFGHDRQAEETREVILGYDPTIPSWGYNGNARRYWDFLYGGKVARIERQIHHYGSALNAVPLFDAYRRDPADLHLLRVAYGGLMGGITNIDQQGFGSAAFHSWPDMMRWDAYSGDYGMGFYGHAIAAATYLVHDDRLGWLGFGGAVTPGQRSIAIVPQDGARRRLFIAPAGLWITLEAGRIARARYDLASGKVQLTLDPAGPNEPQARLVLTTTTATGRRYAADRGTAERGATALALGTGPTVLTLTPR
ncbi:DUF5695 domain-containing protein [Novosphingobium sp. SG720]|uniref:DUF5695 domain-containing protein n=1 Tax=Novosphingobium sp. SG720 TaxID=2586998 RepID=UPI00144774A0|nr:DUF5695 domain-containing protein [Novosphingobium sp. SG720]NKJ40582.1 hypothetical protein [Novosphingobium sp. SG720]